MPKLPVKQALHASMQSFRHRPNLIDAKTGRFRFRTAQAGDASIDMAEWMGDPWIVSGLNMSGQPMTVDQLRSWIGGFDNIRRSLVLILTRNANEPAGFLMVDVELRHKIGSFHLVIGNRRHRRSGAGLAAVRFVLRHLFEVSGVGKVSIEPLSRNMVAVQSCLWLGFRLEGILKSHRLDLKSGERLDQHVFGMTRQEYDSWPWR